MKKYKFADKFADAQITIPILRKTITKDNATDQDVDFLLNKWPGKYDHNFELVGASKPKEEPKQALAFPQDAPNEDWTVEQLKAYADYHGIELGRAKKEASILKKIAEHNG